MNDHYGFCDDPTRSCSCCDNQCWYCDTDSDEDPDRPVAEDSALDDDPDDDDLPDLEGYPILLPNYF